MSLPLKHTGLDVLAVYGRLLRTSSRGDATQVARLFPELGQCMRALVTNRTTWFERHLEELEREPTKNRAEKDAEKVQSVGLPVLLFLLVPPQPFVSTAAPAAAQS